jgi:hypothetical protein
LIWDEALGRVSVLMELLEDEFPWTDVPDFLDSGIGFEVVCSTGLCHSRLPEGSATVSVASELLEEDFP